MLLESSFRPLAASERRLLRAKRHYLESRLRRGPKVLAPAVLVIVMLWALTLVASDAPWSVVTLFWILMGGGIFLWVRHDVGRDLGHLARMLREFQSALRRNEAQVFHVKAKSFVEFEELEDEGACYAFEIDDGRIVFVVGQQFYPGAKFPSHDFSLVYLLDERGASINMVVEKRGRKASAARKVPAAHKLELEIPEHLEVISASPGHIEDFLRQRSS